MGHRMAPYFTTESVAALTLSSIPSGIDTIEKLFVWSAMSLASASNGLQVNAVPDEGQVRAISVSTGVDASNTDRFFVGGYIPYNPSILADGSQKPWQAALAITTSAPHSNFMGN